MRISFDIDDTLICYRPGAAHEPNRVPWILRPWFSEPLRAGARELLRELVREGHEVWIYTTSFRPENKLKWWLRFYGVSVSGVINGMIHRQAFGNRSIPSKLPSAWEIALHIDDSEGVYREGQQYGFEVLVVSPLDTAWVESIRAAVARIDSRSRSLPGDIGGG